MDYYAWSLGDDYNCESCGWSYNKVVFDEWDPDNHIWQLEMLVGCYGGEGVMSNEEDFAVKAEEIIRDCLRYPDFTEDDAEELRNVIAEILAV